MSGGFFRGTSADQDTRFSNKQAKLMKSQKFAPELDHLVDMSKVKMDVVKPWIATRVTEVLGFEDEVLINFIYGLLDGKEINGKEVQIQITGFMEKNTGKFMKELWNLLLSAQKNASGVPQQFLDAKEEEIRKKKAESDLITQEIQRKKEIEQEKQKKMDEEFASKAVDDASDPVSKYSTAQPDDDKVSGGRNGSRRKNRSPRSPRSSERPASPRQITRSGSISKSFSNSRSYSEDSHKSRSRSLSPQSRGRSVSPDRRYVSPRKRLSPRRKYSPRRPRSPLRWRSPYSRRRRSPTPRRRRSPSPMLRSSPSLRRRRSPPAMRRRRSPTPVRRRSPSPVRRRSSPPMRRRSPTLRHKSPSPVRSGSPLVTRRRSPTVSPPARRRSPSSPARLRSPSSPARRRSPSPPLRRRSPSPPARRRSPSPPARRRSPSPPARRRAPSSPARRRSPSPPARRRPPSSPLTRRRSPSPVRRRSPRHRRRSPLRLPTQKYRGGSPYRRRSPAYQRHRSLSRDHDARNNGAGSRRYQDDYRPERTGGRSSPLIPGEGEVEDSGVDSASRHPPISMRSPQRDRTNQSDAGRIVPAHLSSREVSPSHSGSSMHTGKSSASEEQRNMETYASSASPVRQTSVDDSRRTVRESRAHLSRVDEGRRTSPQRRVGHSHKEGAHRSIPTKDSKDEEYSPERLSAHQLGDEERSVDDIEIKRKERDNKSEKASLRIDSLTPNKTAPQPAEYSPGRVEVKEFTSVNAGDEHKSFPRDDNNVDEKSHSQLRDVMGSGIDSEDERKSKGLERKKHKRHDRHHTASEDDSGYDSRIDERKDAKRRRKEEKKLRKEEKRRRREERHRKKEERRAGKLKAKAVDTDKHMSDADDSDDHVAVTEERETEQKKLEIELRKKALESLRAKKAITPSDI